jgi:hypothetical protein
MGSNSEKNEREMGVMYDVGFMIMKACKFKITFRYCALMCLHGMDGYFAHII